MSNLGTLKKDVKVREDELKEQSQKEADRKNKEEELIKKKNEVRTRSSS